MRCLMMVMMDALESSCQSFFEIARRDRRSPDCSTASRESALLLFAIFCTATNMEGKAVIRKRSDSPETASTIVPARRQSEFVLVLRVFLACSLAVLCAVVAP